ncbi:type II toxin-antitoxin system Phd/YefM family antitoxin [Glaciimonas sp. GG7]
MLLDRADQAISSTELQKNTRMLLDRMTDGTQDRYVVIRDNQPSAVMLPIARYEALMAELEDLRIEAVARNRLASIAQLKPISHADMLARFDEDKE